MVSDVRRLAKARSSTPFELAVRLWELKQADPRAFSELVSDLSGAGGAERQRGLSRRRLLYLVQMAEALPLAPFKNRFLKIGWTKTTLIAAVVKKQGVAGLNDLFDLADRHTVAELRVAIANGDLVDGMRCVQLRLSPSQYAQFHAVLIEHGARPIAGRGLQGQEDALMSALETLEPKRAAT